MGIADHVLESISGHLSRRMLEHYSHIRIDAKRQALDALDEQRKNGLREPNGADAPDIQTIVEISDELTSQLRHSLVLRGNPPSGKLLIPLNRRDVRVVEGARVESVGAEDTELSTVDCFELELSTFRTPTFPDPRR